MCLTPCQCVPPSVFLPTQTMVCLTIWMSACVFHNLSAGVDRFQTLHFNWAVRMNNDAYGSLRGSQISLSIVSATPATCKSSQMFPLENRTTTGSVSRGMLNMQAESSETLFHFQIYFPGWDTGRKEFLLLERLLVYTEMLDGGYLELQRWVFQKSEISGLESTLLKSCEEVVWQRRTHKRPGIRHLFIVRNLLLVCKESMSEASSLWSAEAL